MNFGDRIKSGIKAAYNAGRDWQQEQKRQAQERQEQAERRHAELRQRYEEMQRQDEENAKRYEDTLEKFAGKIAVVTNFSRDRGESVPSEVGQLITIRLKQQGFGPVELLIVGGLISVRQGYRLPEFVKSGTYLADGIETEELAQRTGVFAHEHGDRDLYPLTIADRAAHYLEQTESSNLGYIAIVSAPELAPLGVDVYPTVIGAMGDGYESTVNGGVLIPDPGNTPGWQQIIEGDHYKKLPHEIIMADYKEQGF